jgi:hypothetical protein
MATFSSLLSPFISVRVDGVRVCRDGGSAELLLGFGAGATGSGVRKATVRLSTGEVLGPSSCTKCGEDDEQGVRGKM